MHRQAEVHYQENAKTLADIENTYLKEHYKMINWSNVVGMTGFRTAPALKDVIKVIILNYFLLSVWRQLPIGQVCQR